MKSLIRILLLGATAPTPKPSEKQPEKVVVVQKVEKPKPKRFLTAQERLPKDIPKWFVELDKDKDGQISMAEFCEGDWTEKKIKEFDHWDLNGDGFITADEAMKIIKKEKK